jgi:hypothetical protein
VNDRALRSIEHSTLSEGQIESQSLELKAFGNRMKSLLARMDRFRDFGEAEQVRWIAAREGRRRRDGAVLELASAPIRVAGDLKSSVYDALKTVVDLGHASVADSVEFVADRLGLWARPGSIRFQTARFAVRFRVPGDVGGPERFPAARIGRVRARGAGVPCFESSPRHGDARSCCSRRTGFSGARTRRCREG